MILVYQQKHTVRRTAPHWGQLFKREISIREVDSHPHGPWIKSSRSARFCHLHVKQSKSHTILFGLALFNYSKPRLSSFKTIKWYLSFQKWFFSHLYAPAKKRTTLIGKVRRDLLPLSLSDGGGEDQTGALVLYVYRGTLQICALKPALARTTAQKSPDLVPCASASWDAQRMFRCLLQIRNFIKSVTNRNTR